MSAWHGFRLVPPVLLVFVLGCISRRPDPIKPTPPPEPIVPHWFNVWIDSITIDQIMRASGLGFAAMAPVLLVACVVLVFLKMPRMAAMAGALIPVSLASGILFVWLGENITWIRLLILVPTLALGAVWAWKHLVPWIEKASGLDINKDGIIGADDGNRLDQGIKQGTPADH